MNNHVTTVVGIAALTIALVTTGAACSSDSSNGEDSSTTTTTKASSTASTGTLKLDPDHDYGNKYADGILPVGDNQYVTDAAAAKAGVVYLCRAPNGTAGAQAAGPWFINNGTEYDINKKVAVEGNVEWDASYSMNVTGGQRVITTNDLPRDHTTGVFPVAPTDPAYQYDRNPNHIAAQSLTYTLAASPEFATTPSCVGGEAGVMLTGIALFDAFDAGGRDAGAWEVQDGCNGHPQMSSEYHYHTLSSCIHGTGVDTVIGFALDGFPITGPRVGKDNILTTSDLDECHGITSTVTLDGKSVETYHYVMTEDFPYSVSCFRSTASQPPGRPG